MADDGTRYGMPVGYNSDIIKDYLGSRTKALTAQKNAAYGGIDKERSMMYDAMGKMQLQNERDIFQRRTQAQRSGMSSSQLAALEMQNMQVGQMGAKSMIDELALKESELDMQFAGQEDTINADVFQLLNQNMQSAAAVEAQRFASSAIAQAQDLFPNASQGQILKISQLINGADLSDDDMDAIASVTNPDIFTGARLSRTKFNNQVKPITDLSWKEYRRLYDTLNPTEASALAKAVLKDPNKYSR